MSTRPAAAGLVLLAMLAALSHAGSLATIAAAQASRTPPPPGGAFYPPYRPVGPPPFCDRANPPPPGGAFSAGSGRDRSGTARGRSRSDGPPAAATPPPQRDDATRLVSALSMLRNYAAARPMLCREVVPRCDALLDEFASIITAEQLLEVATFATRCNATPTADRALQLVIDRFPGTSHATLAEAQQRRLPRR